MWKRYYNGSKADLTQDMFTAIICREYGWTYAQYLEQPAYWLDIITQMLQAEGSSKSK